MINNPTYLALDVGEKRIGVALGNAIGRLARPAGVLQADGTEIVHLQHMLFEHNVDELVVGLPRNSNGDETKQSHVVRDFVTLRLRGLGLPVSFQDESATSVLAEEHLSQQKKSFAKGDVDALAASIILQDFLDARHG